MIAELGYISLLFSLALTLLSIIFSSVMLVKNQYQYRPFLSCLSQGVTLALCLSYSALVWGFINNDFSILYVAQHGHTALPIFYKMSAAWGGHEGSMLFLTLAMSLWNSLFSILNKKNNLQFYVATQLNSMVIIGLFILFLLLFSDPFERLFPAMFEGRDLNPMLQDLAFIFHPPLLYLGYSGFVIIFSMAMAVLIHPENRRLFLSLGIIWLKVPWGILTLGIMLGAWWAYRELGWGGWWFWDPVENASLLPWLMATATIHMFYVSKCKQAFSYWCILLSLFIFQLGILGTFIVRSGVMTSVHAFAIDETRGLGLIMLLMLTLIIPLYLYVYRINVDNLSSHISLLSKEVMLFAGIILLLIATFTILLGTLYPMILSLLHLGTISVGAPYYHKTLTPILMMLLFLIGCSSCVKWNGSQFAWKKFSIGMFSALSVTFLLSIATDRLFNVELMIWEVLITFMVMTPLLSIKKDNVKWRMWTIHSAVAFCVLAMFIASTYEQNVSVKLTLDDTITLSGYQLTYKERVQGIGDNYTYEKAFIKVTQKGANIAELYPERRIYNERGTVMLEPSVKSLWHGDFYAVLGEALGTDSYSFRLHYKPGVLWIWLMGGIMACVACLPNKKPRA